ncbi:MAG: hypothetical protein JSS04_25135 [Proteobacteria bacterium]|nr:hypothetical protein [Pseudomonadota bacterium]
MSNPDSIKAKREASEQARRLAEQLFLPEDRARALAFAEELEAEARALEQAASDSETNVEVYLSRAYACLDANQRDVLLRGLVEEERRMGSSREHMENGARRVEDCKERVKRQRELLGSLKPHENRLRAEFMLDTFEQTLVLMERHQRLLVERFRKAGL